MASEATTDRWIVLKLVLIMASVFGPVGFGYLWLNGAFEPCTAECVYNTGAP